MLEEKEVGGYDLPKKTVKKKEHIMGKFSHCTIMSDDLIPAYKLSEYPLCICIADIFVS